MEKTDFKAFDCPLALTYKEKFNQPIFGANYLSCSTKPLFNSLPSDANLKIWFMEGGCGKFLQCYRYTLKKIRENVGRQGPNMELLREVQSQSF